MSKAWCHLNYRYGVEVSAPTPDQILSAVEELYVENLVGMTECDYEEHGDAWLRYGYDEGPMYVLTITRSGKAYWK